ncbi:hypothetical protein [Propionibacterium sp.]|uniref:hypothetical protein n=1 Tax=Propionibacterium sp. TaxID=1977903 RepID=UPI0039EBD8F4
METSSLSRGACVVDSLASWTRSIACRLLSGAGSASLVVYEWAPSTAVDSLVHGVSTGGDLVVAACPATGHRISSFPDSFPVDVRLSILKDAADPSVRIKSAGVQALGTFEWVPAAEATRMLLANELPPDVGAILASENGRLGMVKAQRILVHDCSGITSLPLSELMDSLVGEDSMANFPDADEELDANHVVLSCGQEALCRMCDAVTRGNLPGKELTNRPLREGCVRFGDQVFCADVDRTGMVLVRIGTDGTETVFAPFGGDVDSMAELSDQIEGIARGLESLEKSSEWPDTPVSEQLSA